MSSCPACAQGPFYHRQVCTGHGVNLTDSEPPETHMSCFPLMPWLRLRLWASQEVHMCNRRLMNTSGSEIVGTHCSNKDSSSIGVQQSTSCLVFSPLTRCRASYPNPEHNHPAKSLMEKQMCSWHQEHIRETTVSLLDDVDHNK